MSVLDYSGTREDVGTPQPVLPESANHTDLPPIPMSSKGSSKTDQGKPKIDDSNLLKPNGSSSVFIKPIHKILVQSRESSPEPTLPKNVDEEKRVILNVGGMKHETCLHTMLKLPNSRLHELALVLQAEASKSGISSENWVSPEVYFDRDPTIFGFILNFYRTQQLHVPLGVCGPMFKKELDFWMLDDREIEPCCFVTYVSYEETNEALAQFDYSVKDTAAIEEADRKAMNEKGCWQRLRPKLWKGIQNPYSSRLATVYAIISVLLVLVSITVFVVETLPYFGMHTLHSRKHAGQTWTSEDLRKDLDIFTDITHYDILIIIDNCCNIFFFIEFIVKLLAAPKKLKYIRSPIPVIELLCIIPYYLAMAIVFWHHDPIVLFDFLRVLYATRVLRIFRIFVLMKHFMALKILVYTLKASTRELLLLVLILIIGVIIFACIEYYAELLTEDENNVSDFPHIPIAFWWALVTMTTVGYGEVVPKTLFGYSVGACCAISGVLVVALTVPIIVNNFSVYYTHAQSREKLKLRKKELTDSKKAKTQWNKLTGLSLSWRMFKQRPKSNHHKNEKIETDKKGTPSAPLSVKVKPRPPGWTTTVKPKNESSA